MFRPVVWMVKVTAPPSLMEAALGVTEMVGAGAGGVLGQRGAAFAQAVGVGAVGREATVEEDAFAVRLLEAA